MIEASAIQSGMCGSDWMTSMMRCVTVSKRPP